jgi:two-component system nitrate/nitrite response regulator NarL
MEIKNVKTVVICDTEPIAIEGVRALLDLQSDLMMIGAENGIAAGLQMVRNLKPSIAVIDKSFGLHAVMDWVEAARDGSAVVVWGSPISGAEAVRLMQSGARGVVRKTAGLESMIDCMQAVAEGSTWLEQSLLSDSERLPKRSRSNLTPREQQVLDFVEQGLKNKDIAVRMNIRPGTVKIHLKHIFEKTGIHGRYGLALNGLKEKGLLNIAQA